MNLTDEDRERVDRVKKIALFVVLPVEIMFMVLYIFML